MTWAIKQGWRFELVEVVRETAATVFYREHGRSHETRGAKSGFLSWRGDEATGRALCQQLASARGECQRREAAARSWYARRKLEIIAASEAGDAQ